jgi:TRAP-type C4-dicarboxylate transport system permease small subunit
VLERITHAINRVFLWIAGLLAAATLAIIAYDLVLRNVFDEPTAWALDLSRFMMVYLFFFALAPALEAGAHVSVDILEQNMPPRVRRWLQILAMVFVLIFGAFLFWQVMRFTIEAYEDNALFPTYIRVRLIEVYWIAPVGVAEFLLTAFAMLIKRVRAKPEAFAKLPPAPTTLSEGGV